MLVLKASSNILKEISNIFFFILQQKQFVFQNYDLIIFIFIKNTNYFLHHYPKTIERILDGLLGFCYDDQMLGLFKKLCRYYWDIDQKATAEYINIYREMWDSESLNKEGI